VYDGKLIAGGYFTTAGGISANHIAAWDGSSWSSLGEGIGGRYISAFTVYNGKLIVVGDYVTPDGSGIRKIFAWDGSLWTQFGEVFEGGVSELTVYDGKLIAGGWRFTFESGVEVNNISAWDGSSWSSLDGSLNHSGGSLIVFDGKLIVGGSVNSAGWTSTNLISVWNGSLWSHLGSGIGGCNDPRVTVFTEYNGNLIVGGRFTTAGGKVAPYIAQWTKKEFPVSVEDTNHNLPAKFSLSQNYPNPFNPSTTIEFTLPRPGVAKISVYTVSGQRIETLADEMMSAGSHRIVWNVSRRASGVYLVVLESGGMRDARKVTVVK
jgi:hypothetical protein